MLRRVRASGLAGGGALILALTISGVVAAASLMTAVRAPLPDPGPAAIESTTTFEDLDGNGIDDDCQETVVADQEAAAAAAIAVDVDGDGTVSQSEAAHSDRIGGVNCNHGGYVSAVAAESGDEDAGDAEEEVGVQHPAECDAASPVSGPTEPVTGVEQPVIVTANAHGTAVSTVARSEDLGGKNCNHGGAVSEVAKDKVALEAAKEARAEAHAAAKSARDSAKEARAVARAAAKSARDGAREAARSERKANHGKGHNG